MGFSIKEAQEKTLPFKSDYEGQTFEIDYAPAVLTPALSRELEQLAKDEDIHISNCEFIFRGLRRWNWEEQNGDGMKTVEISRENVAQIPYPIITDFVEQIAAVNVGNSQKPNS